MTSTLSKLSASKVLASCCACLMVFTGACEQKRKLKFSQGDGDNLYTISEFTGQTFQVKTGKKRFKGQTSRADRLQVVAPYSSINALDAVEFSIDQGLFAGIDISDFNFYGREDTTYTLKYSFTDTNVVLSKIAAKQDIPSEELTFAKDVGNGQFEVPIMGLPIKLFSVEKVRDDRGKDTRKLSTYGRDYLKDSSHFKIEQNSVRYFEAPKKPDLFSANYFNDKDEWFFTKTLVGRSLKSYDILGGAESALKIRFARTNNSVIGVDLNIAKEQEIIDPTKTITALEIPVEWVDFKTSTAGDDALLKETKLGDEEAGSRFWQERSFALVDFKNADRLGKSYTADNKLELLEVGEDYLSFTIYESSSGNTFKYSLAKSNRKVEGQRLLADDTKYFHIFSADRSKIKGNLFQQEPDFDKLIYAKRFFPENGEIVFHISDNTPNNPEFTEAIQTAVSAWDEAFKKGETGIHVRLDDKRVPLGDVRYNQIVFYGYEIDSTMNGGGMLLGFGPSVQDTRNGQTFAAATHIYLRAYREGIIRNIRSFVRSELGLYNDKKVDGITQFTKADVMLEGGGFINSPVPDLSGLSQIYSSMTEPTGFDGIDKVTADLARDISMGYTKAALTQHLKSEAISSKLKSDSDAICTYANVAASANSWRKIRESCLDGKTPFSSYLDRLLASHASNPNILNAEGEEEAIIACAQPLMKELLISTLIHEIGHNLGLGHNFAASSDAPNFARDENGKIAFPSSSVMDYPDRDFDLYSQAGPYDVAAIRYLYGRKVETSNGQTVSIPANKSMVEAVRDAGATPKRYKMCNDYDNNSNKPFFDPQCLKWDIGGTPAEYVEWAIAQIHADIIQNGYVYNNVETKPNQSLNYFNNFRQIHDYWRYLMYLDTGVNLEKKSEKELRAYVDRRKKTDQNFRLYTEATDKIFDFYEEVLTLPSRVCVVRDAGGATVIGLEEFRRARSAIFSESGVTVQNCKQAMPYLATMREKYSNRSLSVEDRGSDIKSLEFDLDPSSASDRLKRRINFGLEISSLESPSFAQGMDRYKSAVITSLTSRSPFLVALGDQIFAIPSLQQLYKLDMQINFLDVPWYRDRIEKVLMDQLLKGAKMDQVGLSSLGQFQPFFEENVQIATSMAASIVTKSGGVARLSENRLQESLTLSPWPSTTNIVTFLSRAEAENASDMLYIKRSRSIFVADPASQTNAFAIIRRLELMQQASVYGGLQDLIPQVVVASADGTVNLSALISIMESTGLYLQPFQMLKLNELLAKANYVDADGKTKTDPALFSQAVSAFIGNSETVLGWPRAEFDAIRSFLDNHPENFSAQVQMLSNLTQSGVI